MKKIIIINGPNINNIGKREPKLYGKININKYFYKIKKKYLNKNIKIKIYYYNSEGKIINKLHKIELNKEKILGIIINAGAYSHTSLALSDTIKYINSYIIEVHISNIFNREKIRHKSLISPFCNGIIIGLGLKVYEIGIISLILNN
ncbi:MAG: 3-dehydroquinate dehydratase [Candidatus Shikimatogenerans bostrichidophilus]|nr:MAG: 3-dehydroquinate dehydratase [Candidatus Shikimatogenerans bostrichidophilus]